MTIAARKIKPFYQATLSDDIERLRDLDREIKRIEKAASALKSSITTQMSDRGITEACNATGHVIATYTSQDRKSFDRTAFNADYPGVYEGYEKSASNFVFRFK